ncbi:MAG TPA: BamA/TamA family outer membrane protein [Bryobacteraceae bacterium]|nr:BamA/TamA family outer membrane protein [Bryobacteraceae bacterium]
MKCVWLGSLFLAGLLAASPQDSDNNVNARYTVETVILSGKGWTTDLQSETTNKISTGLLHDLTSLIGHKLNPSHLDSLAQSLKKELSAREVIHRIVRGDVPEEVRVEFEVRPARAGLAMNVNQFLYNSKQGFSGSGEAALTTGPQVFALGLVSNADWLPERFSGIVARYEDRSVGTDRLSFKFEAETFHTQWNQATTAAMSTNPLDVPDLYRARQAFQPTATVVLFRPLTLTVGARIERFEGQGPAGPITAADAAIADLHYHQTLEGAGTQQDFDADCSLHSATRTLNTDYVYSLRTAGVRYQYRHGKQVILENAWGGYISGLAPLSDRFVLGNAEYLRGWNKYEIDPLGGNRVISNSVEYHYGPLQAFYDMGAIWDESQPIVARHSVGLGLRESVFSLAVAIPIRAGHVEPIFMMGILP